MKKYELTDETITIDGHTLHRVRYLADVGTVKAGTLGGWIESEDNLSHSGTCLVMGHAAVYGKAKVCFDAWVTGGARISGSALIGGDARIFQNAHIGGGALVHGNAWISGDVIVTGSADVGGNAWFDGSRVIESGFHR